MHYYSHHIGDFVRDTSRLNDAQCMAYLRLMWLYYENEQPLPDDIKILAFKIGSDENTVTMLLQCYFYANALHWHHKRIDDELNKYKNKSELARNSAKSRWNNANAMRTHTESNAKAMLTNNQEPRTNNQEPRTNKKHIRTKVLDDGFHEFWNKYPKKTGKGAAEKSWIILKPKIDLVLNALAWQVDSDQWARGFIPNPATYLNQKRWLDEPVAERAVF